MLSEQQSTIFVKYSDDVVTLKGLTTTGNDKVKIFDFRVMLQVGCYIVHNVKSGNTDLAPQLCLLMAPFHTIMHLFYLIIILKLFVVDEHNTSFSYISYANLKLVLLTRMEVA